MYYDATERRCDGHTANIGGQCTCTADGLYEVVADRDRPPELEFLCGNHLETYRRAGFAVRFVRRVRSWD